MNDIYDPEDEGGEERFKKGLSLALKISTVMWLVIGWAVAFFGGWI
jgi:hypothetical protein